MQFNTSSATAESKGYCRISEATVTVKAKVILPSWRQRGKAEQDVRLIWDTLSSDIKRHEEGHVMIAKNHARELEQKLHGARPTKILRGRSRKGEGDRRPRFSPSTTGRRTNSTASKASISKSACCRLLRYAWMTGRIAGRADELRPNTAASAIHATPSFFCRLVDDVVYWKTMRSPGLTMRLAACAISATS